MRFRDSDQVQAASPRSGAPALYWGLGSFLGGIKDGITNVGHAVGGALDNKYVKGGLAAALAATGAGIPLSAAIMGGAGLAGGALHEGGGLHDAVTDGATGALEGGAAGAVGNVARSGVPGQVGGFLASHLPGASSVGGAIKDAAGNIINGATGGGSTSGGGLSPAALALAAAQTANAASLGKRANDFSQMASDDWTNRAGLRTQGIDQLSRAAAPQPPSPTLSSLASIRNRIAPSPAPSSGATVRTPLTTAA